MPTCPARASSPACVSRLCCYYHAALLPPYGECEAHGKAVAGGRNKLLLLWLRRVQIDIIVREANCFVLFFLMYVNLWAAALSLQHLWMEKWQLMTLVRKGLHRSLIGIFTSGYSEAPTCNLSTFHPLMSVGYLTAPLLARIKRGSFRQ